jgi:threonine/homoserine/homoserine lactone efflux protein
MIGLDQWLLFLAVAVLIAVTPGPGIFYVAARTLAAGRGEGIASSVGTGIGGLVHVAAGAVGVSALVLASAEAFTLLKLAGAAYLLWLAWRTMREAGREAGATLPLAEAVPRLGTRRAFREGVVVEALNPKTAAFFLAFLPQFVDPALAMPVAAQFVLLGLVSVLLNTGVDVVVAFAASRAREGFLTRPMLIRRLRQASGALLCALGAALAFARRPA